jgi:hypothetical protein
VRIYRFDIQKALFNPQCIFISGLRASVSPYFDVTCQLSEKSKPVTDVPIAVQRDSLQQETIAILWSDAVIRVTKSFVPLPNLAAECQILVALCIERDELHGIPEVGSTHRIAQISVIITLSK